MNATAPGGWQRVADSSQLLPGEMQQFWLGELAVVVFNLDGDLYALEDRCTHEDYELSGGSFDTDQGSVECTLHGARFDVRDGRALCAPAYTPARRIEVKREDGGLWLRDPAD
jgi:3-phenylpropionate/trans-cinnamate dioxygenase ferredoxin subunit